MAGWLISVTSGDPEEIHAVHAYVARVASAPQSDLGFLGGFVVALGTGVVLATVWESAYRDLAMVASQRAQQTLKALAPSATIPDPIWNESMSVYRISGFSRKGLRPHAVADAAGPGGSDDLLSRNCAPGPEPGGLPRQAWLEDDGRRGGPFSEVPRHQPTRPHFRGMQPGQAHRTSCLFGIDGRYAPHRSHNMTALKRLRLASPEQQAEGWGVVPAAAAGPG